MLVGSRKPRPKTDPQRLLSPRVRRWHHNRATHFTWWDRLIGTLHPDYDSEPRANVLPISTHLIEKPETLDDAEAEPRLMTIEGGGRRRRRRPSAA
jgi:sterol desaturase/sphingolipid hydroxylase (fatty acid hydroxylase superfamily)